MLSARCSHLSRILDNERIGTMLEYLIISFTVFGIICFICVAGRVVMSAFSRGGAR
jgi:hypothetical protein